MIRALEIAVLGGVLLLGCGEHDNPLRPELLNLDEPAPDRVIELVARTTELPTYPCMEQCHSEREANVTPRELTAFHRRIEIEHAAVMTFCDTCHDAQNLDQFRLINGAAVDFDESDYVCGQCHGEKHRDWARGIHGIQTGSWQTTVRRRTCTACHDPHAPLAGIHLTALPVPENARSSEEEGAH